MYQRKVIGTSGVKVEARVKPGSCPVCDGHDWAVQKTVSRGGRTLAHGQFEVSESVLECKRGCHHPSGAKVTLKALSDRLVPRRGVGYDIVVYVGIQRYVHHCQREEIRTALETEYGTVISTGEVSDLGRLFLEYLAQLSYL